MEGLPLLPGYSFKDPTISKYHVSHSFDMKNGHCIPKTSTLGIGKLPLDSESVQYTKFTDAVRFDPTLTYGRPKPKPSALFRPHFVTYDKKCLAFQGYFKECIPLPNMDDDNYRIRRVNIVYFLEDDTITVIEPTVENCGLPQGRLVKRGRIPRNTDGDLWHWKDLNVGIDMNLHGIVYRLCSCDSYTKEYLLSQGIELNPEEQLPLDPYSQKRKNVNLANVGKPSETKSNDDKLWRFLTYDGKVLRFFAVCCNNDNGEDDPRPYIIRYYLADGCVDISEVFQVNSGRDPFPKFLNKIRLPKDWKNLPSDYPSASMEAASTRKVEYYEPKDFLVGNTLPILARRFFVYDCDDFTRRYYSECMRIDQPARIAVQLSREKKSYPPPPIPPHIGIGTPDDTLQSCFSFVLKSPRKDITKYVVNAGKKLRYTATMDWVHPEDKDRDFIIEYFLANSHILITELPKHNSGIKGGKFLSSMLLPKPGCFHSDNPEYYSPADFGLGSIINVFGHRFIITGADLMVYHYMQANVEKFTADMIESYRSHFTKLGILKSDYDNQVSDPVCHVDDPSIKLTGDTTQKFDVPCQKMVDTTHTTMDDRREYSRMNSQVPPISDLIETKAMDAALKPRKCPC
ncbi:EF-hand domain-containing protein 1 [Nilaparvata lugens]|uniref:EF-hand domain-containing protein 1 n=1 Tax=Nilaparvata lugens TaxID=108931 RepID=UPI00193D2B8B|nr:EF-hand domain-containing protein 1 [Nilaparvata lugens]